ncbi:MAG TPA: VTT domain-containing protein [Candidatus Paceibacterota bacterium]|nr:VTT domain-containing protein [Candidatus Paceibacterota bacterium]
MSRTETAGVLVLAVFFIIGALLSQRFSEEIVRYLDFGIAGMAAYVLAGIIATVIAPVSTLPLLPVGVVLWGPLWAAVLSILGWGIGAMIAFMIARRFRALAARFVDMEKVGKYEKALAGPYLFWNIVFLRMAIPTDILSYAIGLFTSMGAGQYTLATFLGITPFAFVFAYASEASLWFQLGAGLLVLLVIYIGYRKIQKTADLTSEAR